MATQSTNISISGSRSFRERIDAFKAAFVRGFNSYADRRSRIDVIRRLEAKSDAELKALGINREHIVAYVFRDVMYT